MFAVLLTTDGFPGKLVLPYMASIIAKRKANRLYYYVVESARLQGKPRIVQQTYLGTAERVAALVKDRAAPLPLSATTLEFGLPGALWLAAQQCGAWEVLCSLWPPATGLRPLDRALPVAGRDSPHLPARPENRSVRLVPPHHPAFAVGFSGRAVPLAGLLGLL